MLFIELTNVELFKDLTTLEAVDTFFDLHNEYTCTNIDYKLLDKTLGFLFEPNKSNAAKNNLYLLFENATISNFNLYLNRTTDSSTLDSFYRGRYQLENALFEYAPSGEGYFYLEFIEGDAFECFAGKVSLLEKTRVQTLE
jgi:hypothetical protein